MASVLGQGHTAHALHAAASSPRQHVCLLPAQGLRILPQMMDVSIVIGVFIPCKHLELLYKNSSSSRRQATRHVGIGNSFTRLGGYFNVPHHHNILSQVPVTSSLPAQPGGPHFPKALERLSDPGPRLHRKSGGSTGNRRGPSWVPLQRLDHQTILPLPRSHMEPVVEPGIVPKFPDAHALLHKVQISI